MSEGLRTGTVTVDTPDGPMAIYEARPEGLARGAVIVIQEAFGVNEHIEDVTRRFAHAGYDAVAPHLFHRAGGGTASYDDFSQVIPLFAGLDDERLLADVDATLAHLAESGWPPKDVAIVGFCFGGRATFLVSVRRALGAAVGFYGGGIVHGRLPGFPPLVDQVTELRTPWLGIFGDQDESIPVEDVEALREALSLSEVDNEVLLYEGARHGFHNDVRDVYDEDAAQDAWERTLRWLERYVGRGR